MNTSAANATRGQGTTVYPMHIFLGSWELVCGLVGAMVNGFVMHCSSNLINEPSEDPHHHIYIFSLTLANFIFNVVHCPLMFAHYCLRLSLSHAYCNILYFFTHLSTVAASLSLFWINLNKFLFWKRVDTGQSAQSQLSSNRMLTFVMTVWFVSAGWAFYLILGPAAQFESTGSCQVNLHNLTVYIHFVIVFFIIPISVSLLISFYVLFAARAEAKRRALVIALRLEELDWRSSSRSVSLSVASSDDRGPTPSLELDDPDQTSTDVAFVFATTLWSAVSCLPYRIAFICFSLQPSLRLARLTFGLFSLTVANPTVVPFMTIFLLQEYRRTAKYFLQGN